MSYALSSEFHLCYCPMWYLWRSETETTSFCLHIAWMPCNVLKMPSTAEGNFKCPCPTLTSLVMFFAHSTTRACMPILVTNRLEAVKSNVPNFVGRGASRSGSGSPWAWRLTTLMISFSGEASLGLVNSSNNLLKKMLRTRELQSELCLQPPIPWGIRVIGVRKQSSGCNGRNRRPGSSPESPSNRLRTRPKKCFVI